MRTELEEVLGSVIPNDLHKLLSDTTNKYSELAFFRILSDGYKNENGIQQFSTYEIFWNDNEYRDFLEDFQEQFELSNQYVESESLYIIGELNSGNVCIALDGIHKGKIYIADNGDFGITFQSNTLEEFLNSLYPYDEDICNYEALKESVIEKDLISLKDLIENKGGHLVLYRSSYCDREIFDLAYNNKDFEVLNYLIDKGFYGFDRVEKYGLVKK